MIRKCNKCGEIGPHHKKSVICKRCRKVQDSDRNKRGRAFIWEYLENHPCVDCGEQDPVVLEFDHVRGEKSYTITNMALHSLDNIEAEIAKCDVRCANCHRRVTSKRMGYYRRG